MNENGLRHCAQKPSVRPGWPSRERPTAAPQDGQTRLSSGTWGSLRIALAASTAGIAGTVVRPAPSRAPRSRVEEVPIRRVTPPPLPAARADPRAVEASRLDARETVEGESPSPAGDVATEPAPPAAGTPFGAPFEAPFGVPSGPGGGRDGGLPQMSQ